MSNMYADALKGLENIKYFLRIQERDEEADLIDAAVEQIQTASKMWDLDD